MPSHPMSTEAVRHYREWAQAQTTENLSYKLEEIGFIALMGGDLGGPLPTGMRRSLVLQGKAARAELRRRKKQSGTADPKEEQP